MCDPKSKRRRFQFKLRTLLVGVLFASLLASYVGTYYRPSRRGMAEAEGGPFFYVPMDEVRGPEDFTKHQWRTLFFAPANQIDRHGFGGPEPVIDVLWELPSAHRVARSCAG